MNIILARPIPTQSANPLKLFRSDPLECRNYQMWSSTILSGTIPAYPMALGMSLAESGLELPTPPLWPRKWHSLTNKIAMK